MDLSDYEKAWKKHRRNREATQAFWDMRAEEFNDTGRSADGKRRLHQVMELLVSKGFLPQGGTALDIGCGPGKYALAFAKHVGSVIGIDLSPKMIQLARENAQDAGFDHLSFDVVDWEHADLEALGWERKFDLVFASMTPAIHSKETLEKMIAACRGACFLSTFVDRKDSVRDELRSLLGVEGGERDFGQTIYYGFNLLWLMGFRPEITYIDSGWERHYDLPKAISLYTTYMETIQPLNNEEKRRLSLFLEERSENGEIREKVDAKIAWMYWRVSSL